MVKQTAHTLELLACVISILLEYEGSNDVLFVIAESYMLIHFATLPRIFLMTTLYNLADENLCALKIG